MKTVIYYFSATGNGEDIAGRLCTEIEECSMVSIVDADYSQISQCKRIITLTPVYCFGIPNNVKVFIESIKDMVTDEHIISGVMHYGGLAGNAKYYLYRKCMDFGIKLRAVYIVKMPESFTLSMQPPKFMVERSLKRSVKRIKKIAERIKENEYHEVKKNMFSFLDKTHEKTAPQWKDFAQNYNITNECIGCMKCVENCPVGNIEFDKVPIFGDRCICCLSCYHRCPQKAIEYKDGKSKYRYVNPNIQN